MKKLTKKEEQLINETKKLLTMMYNDMEKNVKMVIGYDFQKGKSSTKGKLSTIEVLTDILRQEIAAVKINIYKEKNKKTILGIEAFPCIALFLSMSKELDKIQLLHGEKNSSMICFTPMTPFDCKTPPDYAYKIAPNFYKAIHAKLVFLFIGTLKQVGEKINKKENITTTEKKTSNLFHTVELLEEYLTKEEEEKINKELGIEKLGDALEVLLGLKKYNKGNQ